MARLSLKGIVKRFKETEVLHGIDLEIGDRELIIFVGPSGCGKSTLLRLIAGLDPITDGTLSINEKIMNDVAPSKRGAAMVFQSYALYPHMDVYENMAFGARLMGLSKAEVETRIAEAARMLRLEDYLKRKPRQLSGGQRQRVAIARAVVRKPDVFLLDEPLSNLDAALRADVRLEIARLHREIGGTMIYVTHDQVEAMTLADRIVVMKDGYIEQVGTPRELFETPANTFVATFIGSPKMSLLDVAHSAGQLGIEGTGAIAAPGGLKDGALTIGVRPDALGLVAGHGEGFAGKVIYTEYLGDDSYVYVRLTSGEQVTIRVPPNQFFDADKDVSVTARADALHVFDKTSGQRVA
ncbi:sn-glycerol-3-phosphate ABC transporter ATP-binding protein UgpC [Martelella alba]|uniref:sn-glycerol-3-phosphate ABC transporter ATP-binding protein UgpC n=1 Tax=Martelella alba TaxID=2590451 RepID=A0A506UGC5_9HYPH|nr:sn-glycerol-3-phosphate ABC transporter ATP-binding protein UgpC [Martelella alba]TPW32471.1 sn-glycerol-3-phosphate ABC transporter ATP-binding protein UgpC [Martelella alba]